MKLASTLCLAAASVCALAAIWSPWHWQSAATAVLLVLIGAGLAGQRKPDDIEVHLHDFHGYSPEEVAAEIAKHNSPPVRVQSAGDVSADELAEQIVREQKRRAALHADRPHGRRETGRDDPKPGEPNLPRGKNDYGKKADQ